MSVMNSRSDYENEPPGNSQRPVIIVTNNPGVFLGGQNLLEEQLEISRNRAYCAATTDIIFSVISIIMYTVAIGMWWPVFDNKPILISHSVIYPEIGKAVVIGMMVDVLLCVVGIISDFTLLTAASDQFIDHELAHSKAIVWRYISYIRLLFEYLTCQWISVLFRVFVTIQVSDFIDNLHRNRRFTGRNV